MTRLQELVRGTRRAMASVTLDNINLSEGYDPRRSGLGGGRIELTGGKHATYEALYWTQPWVRTAVDRIAGGIGRLPLDAYIDGDQPGEREKQRDGHLARLLRAPYEGGTPSSWKQAIVTNLLVHSNHIEVKMRPGVGRPPVELSPSSFAYWDVVYGQDRRVEWYVFHPEPAVRIPFRPEEVVHYHPWPLGRGVIARSRLEALRRTLMTEDAAQRAIISAFERGVRPSGAYSVEGRLHPDDMKKLRAQLDEVYGGADNAYKVMLLDNGAKWQNQGGANFVEAEMTKLRQLGREEVNAVMNLPPPSAGDLNRATFSNVTEQHLMEYQDTYGPWTVLIEETLQLQLIDAEPTMHGQYVEFNYKQVLKGDPIREMETVTKAVGGPWMTPDEGRATQNLPPMRDGSGAKLNPAPNTAGTPAGAGSE